MNFTEFSFDQRILAGIQAVGYETPTPIQEEAIPVVLAGKDVLGLAQTGTGKTAAFLLPILQRLTNGPLRSIRALIIAPTRELAEQISQASIEFGQKTKIRTATIYGGVGKTPQIAALNRGVEIIVACPGRLLDLMSDGYVNLNNVEVLVLDEADRMCDMGFLPDIRRILKKLPTQRQTLFFSATMPNDIRDLARDILRDPITVQIGMIAPAETVSHAFYPVPHELKKGLLLAILRHINKKSEQVLIFTRTKHKARNLARDLAREGYLVTALQGNMSQNQRQKSIDGFRDGRVNMLVATDIAARGIDVASISHVINYDIPDTADAYTHRIGRTGRAEQEGDAFTLVTPEDTQMAWEINRAMDAPIAKRRLDAFDYGSFIPEEFPIERPSGGAPRRRSASGSNRQRSSYQRDNSNRPAGGRPSGNRPPRVNSNRR